MCHGYNRLALAVIFDGRFTEFAFQLTADSLDLVYSALVTPATALFTAQAASAMRTRLR
jgi:hypothetical protein